MKCTDNIIVVTGGALDEGFLKEFCESHPSAYIIGVDRGISALKSIEIEPDYVVGDFDSAPAYVRDMYVDKDNALMLEPEKDYTDTHVALQLAINKKPQSIFILGAIGSRMDHTMANIGLLKYCVKHQVDAFILDGNNRIRMIDKCCRIEASKSYGRYISCIPFSDTVTGVTLEGFKYPLYNATMIKEDSIGISNELREEEGRISIDRGYLLVMETKD